jgi:hypothetical protein
MTIPGWARRVALITVALAVVLPFSTGTAQADPIHPAPSGVEAAAGVSTVDGVEAVIGMDLDLGAEIGGHAAVVWLRPDGPWANAEPGEAVTTNH